MTQTGTVKFYNKEKRYGFIISEEQEKDIFFHSSEVEGGVELEEDDKVTFKTKSTKRGVQATKIFLQDEKTNHAKDMEIK